MIPIAALSETQSWRDGSLSIGVTCEGDRLHVRLATDGHYGDELPPEEWQAAAFERAIAGLDCVLVDWPKWSMPPDAWPTVVERMEAKLLRRSLRYARSYPALASLLAAQLRGCWSTEMRWGADASDYVWLVFGSAGGLRVSCGDAQIAALREHTGLAIDERTQQEWTMKLEPGREVAMFERFACWSPTTLQWVRADIG